MYRQRQHSNIDTPATPELPMPPGYHLDILLSPSSNCTQLTSSPDGLEFSLHMCNRNLSDKDPQVIDHNFGHNIVNHTDPYCSDTSYNGHHMLYNSSKIHFPLAHTKPGPIALSRREQDPERKVAKLESKVVSLKERLNSSRKSGKVLEHVIANNDLLQQVLGRMNSISAGSYPPLMKASPPGVVY
ncbi:hypothetical protein SERLA73DRAFT_77991 [Serpula lacrymans var. lacrymans S7.3]|uniref:Uncharacterized protein n=2 Tax=Serpula lacrymans var. lacrymans TaxID=341189 RepID=F8QBT6_SERL3|nr:uncharacterized protein SERLADRAFT_442895 [Serpula lacrymans var. lacrymans S7.9]EGN94055.1 hypothetical protein SERLA73DRAFT_77991 [Serpula lacrymans var. lacrymans S7.3]EGO19408.1 hypothetical protein SERLADRAFT_442895 [Serpula lacrymans var. lacrymans S7.9]